MDKEQKGTPARYAVLRVYVGETEDKKHGVDYTLKEFGARVNKWVDKGYIPQGLTVHNVTHLMEFKHCAYQVCEYIQPLFRPATANVDLDVTTKK